MSEKRYSDAEIASTLNEPALSASEAAIMYGTVRLIAQQLRTERDEARKALEHAMTFADDEETDAEDYEMFYKALGREWPPPELPEEELAKLFGEKPKA